MSSPYIHPHVFTRIIDNSFTFLTSQGLTTLFAAFTSDQGEDRKLIDITSPTEFEFFFGERNFAKHGQQSLNVYNWVTSRGACKALRVTPDDAAYANSVYEILVKDSSTNPADGGYLVEPALTGLGFSEVPVVVASPLADTGLQIKTVLTSIASALAVNKDSIQLAVEEDLVANPNDADGYKRFALGYTVPRGRGSFYNNLALRFNIDNSSDETYSFRVYTVEVIRKLPTGANTIVEGPFRVSFAKDAIGLDRSSMYVTDVLKTYSNMVDFFVFEDQLDALADYLDVNVDLMDVVSGSLRVINGVPENIYTDFPSVQWITTGATDFSKINFMSNGFDGDMSLSNVDTMLRRAYTGLYTPEITDKDMTVVDVMLDANYHTSVKDAMVTLAKDIRGDCMVMLDTGFTASAQQAIQKRRDTLTYSTYHAAIFTQDMIVEDESGKDIRVTPTFVLASKIPSTDLEFGTHKPFVGPRRGVISGVRSYSWFPTEPQKSDLYKARLNYVERSPKRTNFGTQLTSQVQNSDLSNISVVRTLFRMIRQMREVAQEFPFEFNNADSESSLLLALNSIADIYVNNGACEYVTPKIITSAYERRQKIVRIAIDTRFTDLIERIYMDFIVTK